MRLVFYGTCLCLLLIPAFAVHAVASPTPTTPCGDYQNPTTPTGYGSAYNHFSTTKEKIVSAACASTGFTPIIGSSNTTDANFAVYNQGYYWTGTRWQSYTYTPTPGGGRASTQNPGWILGDATTTRIPYQGATTYFVAYTCHFGTTSSPKCGCSDTTCATPKWQLQGVQPPPSSPAPITGPITSVGSAVANVGPGAIYRNGTNGYTAIAQVKRAGPDKLMVEFDDSIIQDGQYNETTSRTSGHTKLNTGWGNVSFSNWSITGGTPATLTLVSRYSIPNQMRGTSLADRALRHRVLLDVNRNLVNGETITVRPVTGGATLTTTVNDRMLSAIVQVPHHGWTTDSSDKKASIGGWFGSAVTGVTTATRWALLNANTGQPVAGWGFADTKPAIRQVRSASDRVVYTQASNSFDLKHDLWEADFSSFTTPGQYQVSVEGFGASVPFELSDNVHLPLIRYTVRGLMYFRHGDQFRTQANVVGPTKPTLKNVRKVATGATAASWSPDGIGNQGKLWDNQTTDTLIDPNGQAKMIRENDPILTAFLPEDITEGYRDAADYDIRPQHHSTMADMLIAVMSFPWLAQQDLGLGEGRVYDKTIRGTRITGTVNISDFDHTILHGIDAWARMQLIPRAGAWVPRDMPANLGDWNGAVRGGFEMGAYIGWNSDFMSWADRPFSGNNAYTVHVLRPDPWSSYAAAGGFGSAALRFQQLGDTKMRTYYYERALAAWNWAAQREGQARTTYNGRVEWDPTWRSNQQFQNAKGIAAVALWLLTGEAQYHTAYKTVTGYNNASDFGGQGTVAARLYYAASRIPALSTGRTFDSAIINTIERNAKNHLSALSTTLNGTSNSLLNRPIGMGHSAPQYGNSWTAARYARLTYFTLVLMDDRLSQSERQSLRRLVDAEVSQMTGRNPDGRPYITGFGYDPIRDVAIGDWQGLGLTIKPPGLSPIGSIPDGQIASAQGQFTGYTINGAENPAGIPALLRRAIGPSILLSGAVAGEGQIEANQWPSIIAPILAHELGN